MSEPRLKHLEIGEGAAARQIVALARKGKHPAIFWLGGFRSDMDGAKAAALDRWAEQAGHACTRFDYSGHGRSGGAFRDGTISRWLEEGLAVFDALAEGPQIFVGSSMGGWLALLLVRRLAERGEADRLAGMLLLAPALDMTKDLMSDKFSARERTRLKKDGFLAQPSAYSDEPDIITRALIEDGEQHLFGDRPIETHCRVHVIQGMQDEDVPWQHATKLMERLAFDDAVLTLVRDGDHRLSRPEDIVRLTTALAELIEG